MLRNLHLNEKMKVSQFDDVTRSRAIILSTFYMKMAIKRKKYGVAQPGTATYVLKYPFSEASANKRYQILGYASDFDLLFTSASEKGSFKTRVAEPLGLSPCKL